VWLVALWRRLRRRHSATGKANVALCCGGGVAAATAPHATATENCTLP